MSKKITVRIESHQNRVGKTTFAGLLTWALMKFNIRPIYTGSDRAQFQQFAVDEHHLDQCMKAVATEDLAVEIIDGVPAQDSVLRSQLKATESLLAEKSIQLEKAEARITALEHEITSLRFDPSKE